MSTLGDLMIRVGCEIDGFQSAMRSVVDQTQEACDAVAEKLESIGNVGQRLSIFGASLTAAITVPLEEIGRRSLDTAGQFEQTGIAFSTLLGSAQAGKDMLAQLYNFAATTPFEIPQVLQGARQIMAFGFSSRDVVPILRTVGDAVAALGTGDAGMQRILMNLGKMQTEGHVTAMTMNHLAEDGIASWQMLANAKGVSIPEVQKMVTARAIPSDVGVNALLSGMSAQFGGLMLNSMESFTSQLSNLKDRITLTAAAIGEVLLPVGKLLINWAQSALSSVQNLSQWFAQLPAPIQAGAIALAGLAAAAGPAIGLIGALGFSLPHIAAGFQALSQIGPYIATLASTIMGFAGEVGTTIWMIGSLISEEGLLAGASFALETGIGALGAVFLSVPALIVGVTIALAALATWVYTNWAGVKAAVTTVWDGLGDIWNATLGPAVSGVKSLFMELWSMVPSGFSTMWNALKSGFSDFKTWLDEKNDAIYESTKKWIEQFPGVKKIEGMSAAFDKGNADKASDDRLDKAKKDLLNPDVFEKLHLQADDWDQKHGRQLKQATEDLAELKKGFDEGKVSAEDFQKATDRVTAFENQKNPYRNVDHATEKPKVPRVDRNAIDALSGEHAHDEAALAFRKAEIEHEYQMALPGTLERNESASNAAAEQIRAAEERKRELDQIALEELQKTKQTIDEKLTHYRRDQAGYQKLIEDKQKAEDKFLQTIQKNAFDLETIKKQANDRIAAEEQKIAEAREKRQQKEYEMALKTTDLRVAAQEKQLQQDIKQHEFEASLADKQLQFELETGTLSKNQYLKLKQEQYDAAYAMEMAAIAKEREEIEKEFDGLRSLALGQMASATTGEERQHASDRLIQIDADHDKRIQPINERQQTVQNTQAGRKQTTKLGIEQNNFNTVWAPVQNGFSTAIANMIKGTQTFRQAWQGMAVSVLGSWINSISQMASKWLTHLAQMGAQWVAHKVLELVVHTATNEAKVASDASAAAQSNAISAASHFKEVLMAAKLAAAKAWSAVVGIPIIGPVLGPVAAAAAFAGVMAFGSFSAEGGAVLPNHNSVLFAHPQEMVLPKHISVGLQNLIASGGLSNASSIMNQSQGGSLSSTALQMMRNTAQADRGDTHHNYNGALHYHAAGGETLTVDAFGKIFKTYVRQNNLKMA